MIVWLDGKHKTISLFIKVLLPIYQAIVLPLYSFDSTMLWRSQCTCKQFLFPSKCMMQWHKKKQIQSKYNASKKSVWQNMLNWMTSYHFSCAWFNFSLTNFISLCPLMTPLGQVYSLDALAQREAAALVAHSHVWLKVTLTDPILLTVRGGQGSTQPKVS